MSGRESYRMTLLPRSAAYRALNDSLPTSSSCAAAATPCDGIEHFVFPFKSTIRSIPSSDETATPEPSASQAWRGFENIDCSAFVYRVSRRRFAEWNGRIIMREMGVSVCSVIARPQGCIAIDRLAAKHFSQHATIPRQQKCRLHAEADVRV